ncbi:hypothetical protein [Dyella sp. 2RAB6]|uniref:hypothetical protein n=1 Tax=Dyella sp. 2RAB6 TaxID=3232992 RepID=UPI003F91EAEC
MKPDQPLGPWPLGIDNKSDITSLKADDRGRVIALRDAVNVDIDRNGGIDRRAGARLVLALPGLHSLWSGDHGTFGVAGGQLYAITPQAVRPVAALNSDDPCSFDTLNEATVVSNRTSLVEVRGSAARPLALPRGAPPALAAAAAGGLPGGRYSVAVSYVRGDQEGALSTAQLLVLTDGQGIQLQGIQWPVGMDRLRVYRTELGGEVFYHCTDVPAGMLSYLLGNDQLGRAATTQFLAPMPPGEFVQLWRGRLLLARGRTLIFSEPLNYGLTSPRHGFVQFASRITLIVGVQAGVFVGTREGVVFLRGTKPGEWSREEKTSDAPIPRCRAVIDGGLLPANFQLAGQMIAAWLGPTGFVLGSAEGQLIQPQADRLAVEGAVAGAIVAHGRRITATLH